MLMVLVLQGGTVKQQMLSLEEPVEQEILSRLSSQLNERFAWLAASQLAAMTADLSPLGKQVAGIVAQALAAVDTQARGQFYREGLVHVLGEPEFVEGGQVRQMVQVLEGPALVDVVSEVAEPLEIGSVQVLIGGEGRWRELAELSLVLSRYGVEGGSSGLLGVIGPLRMTYDRAIGAVRYVARLMSDLVSDWYE
jgi:heat-inducible transcriptional repressor